MTQQAASDRDLSVVHSTFVLERSFPQSPEKVFSAFAIAARHKRWFADSDHHDVEQFEQDFRPGGRELTRYRFREGSPFPGVALVNEGFYQDIVEDRRIVMASTMSLGDNRISVSLLTIELRPSQNGTEMVCTHQGAYFEGSGGPEMREAGWRTLFDKLAKALAAE
jgi:uncharacterized protein YndB with AHSA1/START domain